MISMRFLSPFLGYDFQPSISSFMFFQFLPMDTGSVLPINMSPITPLLALQRPPAQVIAITSLEKGAFLQSLDPGATVPKRHFPSQCSQMKVSEGPSADSFQAKVSMRQCRSSHATSPKRQCPSELSQTNVSKPNFPS